MKSLPFPVGTRIVPVFEVCIPLAIAMALSASDSGRDFGSGLISICCAILWLLSVI